MFEICRVHQHSFLLHLSLRLLMILMSVHAIDNLVHRL